MSLETLKIDGNRFAEVGDGFIERITFGVATEEGRAHRVIPVVSLGFEDRGISHRAIDTRP